MARTPTINTSSSKRKPSSIGLSNRDRERLTTLMGNVDDILNNIELSLYGTTQKSDIDNITDNFNDIMKTQLDLINRQSPNNVSSFLDRLYDSEIKSGSGNSSMRQMEKIFGAQDNGIMTYLSEQYQSKLRKYADLKEVSSQLIELHEAILVMRDAIVSPDVSDGSIARSIDIEGSSKADEIKSVIKNMEKKFSIQKKIKNFITVNALEYGAYYAYIIPYRDMFKKFSDNCGSNASIQYSNNSNLYHESTLYDILNANNIEKGSGKKNETELNSYMKESVADISGIAKSTFGNIFEDAEFEESVKKSVESMLQRITICEDGQPIPFLEEGRYSMEYVYTEFVKCESTRCESSSFESVHSVDLGSYSTDSSRNKSSFDGVTDCYIKFIDPIHLIPCKIMKKVIGYYYIQESDAMPTAGFFGSNFQYNAYVTSGKDRDVVNRIAARIVQAFDKKFLQENAEMKELIAEALMYFDLNTKKLKFQFIPVEYICPFVINEDEAGDGTSIVGPSLFYAKLYLMLLLFKITSIVLYSNDTKVNYVRTSGMDKDVANKIQDIIRDKQRHTTNVTDLANYPSMMKKIGHGTEQYIPVGRNNEHGIETEILQGQDVQLNTELMELLRTCYILGTGVPSAIMNYLNEADFAKSIEVANSRFLGRVMSLQLDFNESITRFYRMVAMYSTNLDQEDIDNMTVTLTAPKQQNNIIKQEAVSGFEALKDFIMKIFYGDDWQSTEDRSEKEVHKDFVRYLITQYMPFIDIDDLTKVHENLEIEKVKKQLDPSQKNTSSIDDIDISGI